MALMQMIADSRFLRDSLRFVGAGLANTAFTLLVYQGLLFIVNHQAAYAGAWAAGLVFVVLFYPNRVFGKRNPKAWSLVALALNCGGIFFIGSITLQFLIGLGVAPRLSVFVVLLLTSTANFVLGRWIFK